MKKQFRGYSMKTILIVDDDEDLLFCYQTLLENNETTIYISPTVKGALNILDFAKIDVAILDYMLPEITGDKLGLYINKMHPAVKIYFISGYDEVHDAVKKLNVTVQGIFKKPVDPAMLLQIVESNDFEEVNEENGSYPVESLNSYLNHRK
jgi:DNA-binding NtrC family response regulator